MKEVFDRALKFVESKLGPVNHVVLVCDIDSDEGVHLYSNEQLWGFTKLNGLYEKVVPSKDLTKNQTNALHRYLIVGPAVRKTNKVVSDIYSKDLECDLFHVDRHPEYVFIPTAKIIKDILRNDDYAESYGGLEDSIIVHELAHNISPDIERRMAKRFGVGKGDIIYLAYKGGNEKLGTGHGFSKTVQGEMFAKYTEMLYLKEHYPEVYEKRRNEFIDEIRKDERFRVWNHNSLRITTNPHGPDPHPPASKLFLAVEQNPELKGFVNSLYKE